MASLLRQGTTENHSCVNFEEKNFQFLGDDGEIFHTAGYECVECNQFYTATGLEHLASERRQSPVHLMQDDLLMDEDQAEIDLCLGNVDIEDTKQMFQTDPGHSEMDMEMKSYSSYTAIATDSAPIKCDDTTGESSVAMASSDPGFLIGQPRVDYSQLLVGSSQTTATMDNSVSNQTELDKHFSNISSPTSTSQSFHVRSSAESISTSSREQAPPIISTFTSSNEIEFKISGENAVVSDIRDYFQESSLNDSLDRQNEEQQSNFSISSYGDELQKNLEMQPILAAEHQNFKVLDIVQSSESFEKYLKQSSVTRDTSVRDEGIHKLLDGVGDNRERKLSHDDSHHSSDNREDSLSRDDDFHSGINDSSQVVLDSLVSENTGKLPSDREMQHGVASSAQLLPCIRDNREQVVNEGNKQDLPASNRLQDSVGQMLQPVGDNGGRSEVSSDSALMSLERKKSFEEQRDGNPNEEVSYDAISTKVSQEESGTDVESKDLGKRSMVLAKLIAELESSGDSKKEEGTKVLFLNSSNSKVDTEVSITISKDVKRERVGPKPSKVIDLRDKETAEADVTQTPKTEDSSTKLAQDATEEHTSSATSNETREEEDQLLGSREVLKPVPLNPPTSQPKHNLPIMTDIPPAVRFKTITLYKCKFCNARFFTRDALERHSYRSHADRMVAVDTEATGKGQKTSNDLQSCDKNMERGSNMDEGQPKVNSVQVKREPPDQTWQKRVKLRVVRIKQRKQEDCVNTENTYLCYCGEKLKSVEELDTHRATKHSGETETPSEHTISCRECERQFESEQALHIHMLTCRGSSKSTEHDKHSTSSPQNANIEVDTPATDTAVAVVRKLFTDNKGGNHRKDNDQDMSSPRVSKESVNTKETVVPLLKVKTEEESQSTLPEDEMVSSVQEVVSSEEQHINTSNLDLVGDLTEVTGSVQPQQPGLYSLVLSDHTEDSRTEKNSRYDIERDILSITCIRCQKTYSCDEKCNWTLQCSACRWNFACPAHLQCHYDHFHLHDRSCPLCKYSLSRGSGTMMDRHFKTAHPNAEIYHCYLCETTFTTRACLGNHLSRHFTGTGAHECPHCRMRFEKASRLNVHKVRSHTRLLGYPTRCTATPDYPTLYMCGVCGRQYEYEGTLRMHLRKHTGLGQGVGALNVETSGVGEGSQKGVGNAIGVRHSVVEAENMQGSLVQRTDKDVGVGLSGVKLELAGYGQGVGHLAVAATNIEEGVGIG